MVKNILKIPILIFTNPKKTITVAYAIIMDLWINKIIKHPIKFQDLFGLYYWQYPGDPIRFNLTNKSATDAIHIIHYLFSNVNEDWICIDLGANIGAVSVSMTNIIKNGTGTVFSIEADPANIPKLKKNLLLNDFNSDNVYNFAAVKADIKEVTLKCFPESNGWQTIAHKLPSHVLESDFYEVTVPAMKLSAFIKGKRLVSIDLLKLDIEGAELMVLQDLEPLLKMKIVKRVIFEVNEITLNAMGSTVNDLFSFWDRLDYNLREINADGSLSNFEDWGDRYGDCIAIAEGLDDF